ncbi:MAG: acetoacetate decarboxylase family protein [Flavobacteriales bacterium]
MKSIKFLFLALVAILASCSKNDDDDSSQTVFADFKYDIQIKENKAIVTLENTSQNATEFAWSFPDGETANSSQENPIVTYTKNGNYLMTLEASNGNISDTKSIEIKIDSLFNYTPYRYLENDGIFMYYETTNVQAYKSLIPEEFNMPSRMVVFSFFNDFYKLDYGATPYKENAISILVEYQGEEFFHCVYMPVTDEHSMWAGILGLGLPKTMGEINFVRNNPIYLGDRKNPLGGTMDMSVDTENYNIDPNTKQEIIDLQKLRSLQKRNGQIIVTGNSGGNQNSVIETAEQFPNLITIKFGEATMVTNTSSIPYHHPLDLVPSNVIGAFYLKNTIPFSLTGTPL